MPEDAGVRVTFWYQPGLRPYTPDAPPRDSPQTPVYRSLIPRMAVSLSPDTRFSKVPIE